jgi:hypothetical protein
VDFYAHFKEWMRGSFYSRERTGVVIGEILEMKVGFEWHMSWRSQGHLKKSGSPTSCCDKEIRMDLF